MTFIVKRTGPSDLGTVQGQTYPAAERRADGYIRLEEQDDGGWPIWFHPSGFEPVEDGEVKP